MAIALYPPAWRRRYGGELAELAVRETASRRELWRTVVDLVRGAGAEWCRIAGLSGVSVTRRDAALGGWVAVLWSWAIFMVAGSVLQKGSEHWQSAMPPALRSDPEIVFGVLIAAAAVTAIGVASAAAIAAPAMWRALTSGAWRVVRGPLYAAAALSLLAGAAGVIVVIWAHTLGVAARNGQDPGYAGAVVVAAGLGVASAGVWCIAISRLIRASRIGRPILVAGGALSAGVAATMVLACVAAIVWWALVERDGSHAEAAPGAIDAAIVAMVLACVGACRGAIRATRMAHAVRGD